MQWKKNSWGRIPLMKRPTMKPPALGDVSFGKNDGSLRPEIIKGGRFPSNSIWPIDCKNSLT